MSEARRAVLNSARPPAQRGTGAGAARSQQARLAALRPRDSSYQIVVSVPTSCPDVMPTVYRPALHRCVGAGAAEGPPGGTGSASIRRIGFHLRSDGGAWSALKVATCRRRRRHQGAGVLRRPHCPHQFAKCRLLRIDAPPSRRLTALPPHSAPSIGRGTRLLLSRGGEPGGLLRRRSAHPPSSRVAAAPAPPALYAGGQFRCAFGRRPFPPACCRFKKAASRCFPGSLLPRRLGRWRLSGAATAPGFRLAA